MARAISPGDVTGYWKGATTPYYPDEKYTTHWKEVKIFTAKEGNKTLIFGRGISNWMKEDYFFNLRGSIDQGDQLKLVFTKTHYFLKGKNQKNEVNYNGYIEYKGNTLTMEANWPGGSLKLERYNDIHEIEMKFLSLCMNWTAKIKLDQMPQRIETDQVLLKFKLVHKGIDVKGIAIVNNKQRGSFKLDGTMNEDKEKKNDYIGEMTLSGAVDGCVVDDEVEIRYNSDLYHLKSIARDQGVIQIKIGEVWEYQDVQLSRKNILTPDTKIDRLHEIPSHKPQFAPRRSARKPKEGLLMQKAKEIIRFLKNPGQRTQRESRQP